MNRPLARRLVGVNPSFSGLAVAVLIAGCGESTASPTPVLPAGHTVVAASCAGASPAKKLAMARVVFVGRMLPGPSTAGGRPHVLTSPAMVRVARHLKGNGPKTVKVTTAVMTTTNGGVAVTEDGIEPQAGEIWKIYAGDRHEPFDTTICAGSTRIRSAVRPADPSPHSQLSPPLT